MSLNISSLLKNINISNVASTTNKTLNIVKKSIPIYKEVRPYFNHEKSLFKKPKNILIDEIKESKPLKVNKSITYNNDNLTFFQ